MSQKVLLAAAALAVTIGHIDAKKGWGITLPLQITPNEHGHPLVQREFLIPSVLTHKKFSRELPLGKGFKISPTTFFDEDEDDSIYHPHNVNHKGQRNKRDSQYHILQQQQQQQQLFDEDDDNDNELQSRQLQFQHNNRQYNRENNTYQHNTITTTTTMSEPDFDDIGFEYGDFGAKGIFLASINLYDYTFRTSFEALIQMNNKHHLDFTNWNLNPNRPIDPLCNAPPTIQCITPFKTISDLIDQDRFDDLDDYTNMVMGGTVIVPYFSAVHAAYESGLIQYFEMTSQQSQELYIAYQNTKALILQANRGILPSSTDHIDIKFNKVIPILQQFTPTQIQTIFHNAKMNNRLNNNNGNNNINNINDEDNNDYDIFDEEDDIQSIKKVINKVNPHIGTKPFFLPSENGIIKSNRIKTILKTHNEDDMKYNNKVHKWSHNGFKPKFKKPSSLQFQPNEEW